MRSFRIIYIALAVLLFSSCDNFLDKGPLDTFTNENFWTSENNVIGYSNTFYNDFSGYGNSGGTGWYYFRTLNDDQAGGSFTDWSFQNVPASDGTWSGSWIEIRRASILLDNVDNVAMSDEAKKHWTGVGRLMRAWHYYQLVRAFGDVPWVDKPLDITDEGVLYGKRVDRDMIMDNVLEDLNFATQNMYVNQKKNSLNRDVAYAMKAEICLFEGTFRKYRKQEDGQKAPDASGATRFLTEAKSAAAALMARPYSLNSSYQGNYNSIDLKSNPEMILFKEYKKDVFHHSLIAYISSSTQINGMSKDAFESYLFSDGKPLALTSLDKDDAAIMKVGTKVVGGVEVPDTVMSIKHMLDLRDKRLVQTIDTALCYVSRGFTRYGSGISMNSSTGYGVCKYDNPTLDNMYRNQTVANFTHAPLFWLSVVYLQYAEACAELGDITQSDLDNSINKLRARAELPPLNVNVGFSDPANDMGVSDLIWEIRRERRVELMFDNWIRYWDLIRWHQLHKLDSSNNPDILLGANIVNDTSNKLIDREGKYIDGSKNKIRTFDKKHYWYPIPSGQIDLNPELGQNEGWK